MKRTFVAGLVLSMALGTAVSSQPNHMKPYVTSITNPLGQPLVGPDGYPPDDVMIKIPLRAEDRKYADLDGAKMKQWVKDIGAISLKDRDRGVLYWGRNIGSQGHIDAEDWTVAQFNRIGLTDVKKVPAPPLAMWQTTSYDITFSEGNMTFKLPSARPSLSLSTPPGGIEAELAWVGQGSEADFMGKDVKGKLVLVQDIPEPGDIRHSITAEGAVARAYAKGAAMVGIVYGISDNFSDWQGTANKPGINLGFQDGMRLRNMIGEGKTVKVKYNLVADRKERLPAATVWATLPGNTDEEIIILAHLDAFFEGALDNASGMAVMVNLAEHYAKIPKAQRRRTIHFVGSVGHHGPNGGAGGPGTKQMHDTHNFSKTALIINLEHVAVTRTKYWGPNLRLTTAVSPMRWTVNGSPALVKMAREGLNRFNVGTTFDMDPTGGGEAGNVWRDAPSFQVITSPEIKHTEQDTHEWVPAVGLEQSARAFARVIDQVNTVSLAALQPSWPPGSAPAAGGGE